MSQELFEFLGSCFILLRISMQNMAPHYRVCKAIPCFERPVGRQVSVGVCDCQREGGELGGRISALRCTQVIQSEQRSE